MQPFSRHLSHKKFLLSWLFCLELFSIGYLYMQGEWLGLNLAGYLQAIEMNGGFLTPMLFIVVCPAYLLLKELEKPTDQELIRNKSRLMVCVNQVAWNAIVAGLTVTAYQAANLLIPTVRYQTFVILVGHAMPLVLLFGFLLCIGTFYDLINDTLHNWLAVFIATLPAVLIYATSEVQFPLFKQFSAFTELANAWAALLLSTYLLATYCLLLLLYLSIAPSRDLR